MIKSFLSISLSFPSTSSPSFMNASSLTEQILELRQRTDAFKESIRTRSEKMNYTFYDGPPFTSGDPHYGHLLQSIVKDMVPRRMTMRGYRVNRKRGWDCHGIPAENFVNKKLGITSKKQVEEEFGLQNYIEACRTMVNEVNTHRKRTVDHIGRWVDMENAYFTMDNNFMESVICLFSDLYHRNLIYKGFKVLGYSRALGTALSNSEIAEGYEMRQDPAVTVKFLLKNTPVTQQSVGTQFFASDSAIEVVCGVIKDAAGRTLMIYENRHNARYFPGGKIESGETPADALKREIREELGVDVLTEHFLGHAKTIHKSKLYRLHYFEITITGTPTIQEPHHHGMLEWITKIPSENNYGYVLKFADNIISDEFSLRHDFADIHMLEQGLIGHEMSGDASVSILPWTTTPWTLPANMFAAVHRDIDYMQIFDKTTKEYYVLAEACLSKYYKTADDYIEVGVFKGAELIGMSYTPLYSYYHDAEFDDSYKAQVHTILHAEFVTIESGTGIVHEAPAFGADDYDLVASHLGRDNAQAWLFDPVNEYGEFTNEATYFAGMNVFDANSEIIKELKSRGLLIKQETYNHSYPHCPRTKTPLIYKAIESRFVKEDDLKAQTVPAAENIHFVPETVKARFINGLASAPDRNISRTRYRGAPLPVWVSADGEVTKVVGSLEEIYQLNKPTKQLTKIILVRHGRTDYNEMKWVDCLPADKARLNDLGMQQANQLGELISTHQIDAVYCSPLTRCQQTVQPLVNTLQKECIIDERLQEFKREEFQDSIFDCSTLTWDGGAIGGTESVQDVAKRVEEFYLDILQKHAGQTVVICTHGDPLCLIRRFMWNKEYTDAKNNLYVKNKHVDLLPYAIEYVRSDTGKGLDLHRPYIDNVILIDPDTNKELHRIPEVLDCRFESGAMPYGQDHFMKIPQKRNQTLDSRNQNLEGYIFIDNLPTERREELKKLRLDSLLELPEIFGPKSVYDYESVQENDFWINRLTGGIFRYMFLEKDGILIGMIRGKLVDDDNTKLGIYNFYIKREFRGVGLGSYLYNKMLQILRKDYPQVNTLMLNVINGNEQELINMYQRRGYKIVKSDVRDAYGEVVPLTVLENDISGISNLESEISFSNCANFIAEGLDQTRGWFRALHVLGHAYHGQNVFQNVVVTGMILAEDGKKMSKSLQNYPDPTILINQYGADALRLYLLASPVVRAEPLRFSEKGVEQMLKDVVIPLQNVFNFFKMYAEADKRKDDGTQVWFMRHALKANVSVKEQLDTGWITTEGETLKDIDLPLASEGFQQLQSQEFIETVLRINPDVIICSDFLRTKQTAQGVTDVLQQYGEKSISLEITSDWGYNIKPSDQYDQINTYEKGEYSLDARGSDTIYEELLKKHEGKRILIVSHKRRFRYLWQWLMNIENDINTAKNTKKYQPMFEKPVQLPLCPLHNELDQWVLAELHRTIGLVDGALHEYKLEEATQHLVSFVEKVTNWYLRRSRRRFWTEAMTEDKQQAYTTLFTVLRTYLQLCAPFIPFVTEQLWQELSVFSNAIEAHPSIHLQSRPLTSPIYSNQQLIEEVETVRKIIKGAMYLRAKHQVKVKQPLSELQFKL